MSCFQPRFLVLSLGTLAIAAGCLPREQPEKKASPSGSAADQPAQFSGKTDPGQSKANGPSKANSQSKASGQNTANKSPANQAKAATKTPAVSKTTSDPLLKRRFSDRFARDQLGPNWRATTRGKWNIEDGQLCGKGARNHPVWLTKRLPVNARIEFDATSHSDDGDIKAEFWGNGRSHATAVSYTNATSYLTIFGGWKNRFHVLARIDEHAKDRPQVRIQEGSDDLRAQPVEPERTYRFKVERQDGKTISWLVDDIELLKLEDKEPLRGAGHEHFGFNNWEVRVCFDNLEITPL